MSNGLYNGIDNGLHNGIYDGLNNGCTEGMFYENGKLDVIKNGLKLYINPNINKCYVGDGVKMYDLSGNNNHATLVGGATYKKELYYSYIQLDGISGYVNLPITGFAPPELSYSVWVNGTATFHVLDNNDQPELRLRWYTSRINARLYDNGAYFINANGTTVVDINKWNNITVCCKNGSQQVYLNGRLEISGTGAFDGNSTRNLLEHKIGTYTRGNEGFSNMKVGAYLFYNRSLSASEVKYNYEYLRPLFIK